MAGDWIKVRTTLPNDGRLKIVSRKCHASSVTTLGALVTLWSFADAHADADGVLLGYAAEDVDLLVSVPGFCAALPADWIDLSGEWVRLPEYQEHNGSTAKARAQTTKRKRHERNVTNVTPESRTNRDTSVTREEKRRAEIKDTPIVPDGDASLAELVIGLYHATLPNCAVMATRTPKRIKRIRNADKLAKQLCQQQGWEYKPASFWEAYFGECANDPWLRGDVPNPNNTRWKQNLDVLLHEDRFAGVMDGAIASMRSAP